MDTRDSKIRYVKIQRWEPQFEAILNAEAALIDVCYYRVHRPFIRVSPIINQQRVTSQ
jgi:hypothetical protein